MQNLGKTMPFLTPEEAAHCIYYHSATVLFSELTWEEHKVWCI